MSSSSPEEYKIIQSLSSPSNGFNINLNNGGKYRISCQFFHWDDETKKVFDEVRISPILLKSLLISDSIFSHFKQITLSYYSSLDTFIDDSDSRLNDESSPAGSKTQRTNAQATPTPAKNTMFTFLGGGRDRVRVGFYSLNNTTFQDSYYNQNAIVDDDFVVVQKQESETDQLNDPYNKTVVSLTLIPVSVYDLMTTFPQWTTGFDKWAPDAEMDKMGDVKSGVSTGVCIKELLEKCNKEIHMESFDAGISKINFTSILNNSAYTTICKIFDYHSSQYGGPCIFKWNEFLKQFQLRPISDLFMWPVSDSLKLLSISHKKTDDNFNIISITPSHSNIKFITEDLTMYMSDSLSRAPKINVSRHKSTFSLNFDQYKDEENMLSDGSLYFNELSTDKKTAFQYNKAICCNMGRSFFDPHYRVGERSSFNKQSLMRYFNSFGISYMTPGTDGRMESGRLFTVRSVDGATTEIDKNINGLYLISNVLSEISFTDSSYTCMIVGFKNRQAKQGSFKIGEEEIHTFQLPTSMH